MSDQKTSDLRAGIRIADFEIKAHIGHGGFGDVFLARSQATDRYRAVKVVRRNRFDSERPYEIEFAGVKRFEEVSREHEGFVDILHVSRDKEARYFAYVMELADDIEAGQQIDPQRYVPKTLAKELERRKRLPPGECVRVGVALIAALAELHRRGWVHRDVKPANIVFIRGAPKLADVGLITEAQDHPHTLVGTPDYMDAEVHGSLAGDLYSFGKVLYVMATGHHPSQWPGLPTDVGSISEVPVFQELGAIWRKACDGNRSRRYHSAGEIHRELLALQAGASVLRLKRFDRAMGLVRRYGLMFLVVLVSLLVAGYLTIKEHKQAAELRQRKVGSYVAYGNHALAGGDLLGSLSWFAEAWRVDPYSDKNDLIHRTRLGSVLEHAPTLVQMWFQDRQIKEAFFAGQENQVVISDSSGRWRVYDLVSGLPLYKPFGTGLPGEKISLSTRTLTAVTWADTNCVCLWNYQTGAKLLQLDRPNKLANAVLSPDGKFIAAAETSTNNSENVLLWKTPKGPPVVLGEHPGGTLCLAFSPDSRLLLSGGYDAQARIWDAEAARLVSTFTNHGPQGWIYNGTFSPDARRAATASYDRSVRIWDPHTAVELARLIHDDAVYGAEFNSDGTRLVTAGLDFTARIWDPATEASLQVLRHNSKVIRAAFSPQDELLLTSCYDDTVRVWSLRKPAPLPPAAGLLTFDGRRMILRTNGTWSLLNTSGAVVGRLNATNQFDVTFHFSPEGRCFVVASPAEHGGEAVLRAQCWDAQTALACGQTMMLPQAWTNLVLNPGGTRLLAFNAATGAVWDCNAGQRIASISNGCDSAAFSPDGKLLAVARQHQVEILNLEDNLAPLVTCAHPEYSMVSSIEWDPSGRRLITSCWDRKFTPLQAQVWTARTGKAAGPPLEHRDGVRYATFDHQGARVITCGEDFVAILWDPATGRRLAPPLVHRNQVFYAAFSNDDRLIATATRDNMITIWSAETGDPLALPLALSRAPTEQRLSLRFTADNSAVIIHDGRGQTYCWTLPRYDRPLEDLLLTAQLLAAQQTDSTESLTPHSREALRRIWQKLRSKYPTDFSLSPK
jgi:WD40 repeat protein/serine/threonine protein kinase